MEDQNSLYVNFITYYIYIYIYRDVEVFQMLHFRLGDSDSWVY